MTLAPVDRDQDRLMAIPEVATYLGCTKRTIWVLINKGVLPTHQVRGKHARTVILARDVYAFEKVRTPAVLGRPWGSRNTPKEQQPKQPRSKEPRSKKLQQELLTPPPHVPTETAETAETQPAPVPVTSMPAIPVTTAVPATTTVPLPLVPATKLYIRWD